MEIIENVTFMPFFFCFHMLKLMCHCEDSKQMGKGQDFFAAKCVSMATAICVQYRKASFVLPWWLIRGGRSATFCFAFHLALRTIVRTRISLVAVDGEYPQELNTYI